MHKINHRLKRLRQRAMELLNSEKGRYHRSKRGVEVESVLGSIKHNKRFRRLLLKGLLKIGVGLLALAHNLAKIAT